MRQFVIEDNIMNIAKNILGFPQIVSSKCRGDRGEILMEALGPSIAKLLSQCPGGVFSNDTAYLIVIQLVERLRDLHCMGYVHNDIKLDNVLIGHKSP
jgi:serine/threonine protein kinase